MAPSPALDLQGLTKVYRAGLNRRRAAALDGLDLRVDEGAIYGFVGPNGAGKSTAIKMLVGLIAPTRGEARIFGRSIREASSRDVVGYLPENPSFHDFLRPMEVLAYLGRLSGMREPELSRRSRALLEEVGLAEAADLTVRKFSKGMVQRLGLAQALLHDPPLLILDEPMSGLDPIGRKDVRDLVTGLRRRGKTVFFSTHILPDVETICDRVGMLARGKLVAEGPIRELLDGTIRQVEVRCANVPPELRVALGASASEVRELPDALTFVFRDLDAANEAARRVLATPHGRVLEIQPARETLEETFMRLARAPAGHERADRAVAST
jgi:ABC-2 type transport system ATP-binding protein